jgi:putative ABC transport system ATP-binding protein
MSSSTLLTPAATRRAAPGVAAVEATAVFKTYGSNGQAVHALRGVDVVVGAGEMVAVMGPSGCGKTTLLNCLSGLDEVDGGTVLINGKDIAGMADKVRTSYQATAMGFHLPDVQPPPRALRCRERGASTRRFRVGRREARQRAVAALDRVGLRDRANARPSQLSGGQRQRVTVARSLVNNPAIVWADEPTGALDTRTSNEVLELMEDLNRSHGTTFVVVTHDARVGARCHRVIRMEDGRIIGEESNR